MSGGGGVKVTGLNVCRSVKVFCIGRVSTVRGVRAAAQGFGLKSVNSRLVDVIQHASLRNPLIFSPLSTKLQDCIFFGGGGVETLSNSFLVAKLNCSCP